MIMYKCKCCGHETLPVPPEDAVAYICPICWWENDVFTADDDEPSDENHGLSLNQGRKNFRQHGICDPRLKEPNGRVPEDGCISNNTASDQIIGASYRYKLTDTNNTGELK
ncbi:MAG: hypothetical protein IJX14_04780 [Clostridia bacterium]|nr:hypothetical protein [Clostridia bacterium]